MHLKRLCLVCTTFAMQTSFVVISARHADARSYMIFGPRTTGDQTLSTLEADHLVARCPLDCNAVSRNEMPPRHIVFPRQILDTILLELEREGWSHPMPLTFRSATGLEFESTCSCGTA